MSDRYRPDIDGLRAVAVGAVVSFHAFPNLVKGGFVGVDVFFVISGFLISKIIFQGLQNNNFSYLDFYRRRIQRIFPALAIVCISTFVTGWYVLLPDEFSKLGKQVGAGAAFIANFALWNESGYFDTAADTKPLLHLWSLAIEEQFYIFWPIFLSLIWARRAASWIAAATALSFLINILLVRSDVVAAFYSPASRFWELSLGAALAHVSLNRPEIFGKWRELKSVTGMVMLCVCIAFITKESSFPGYWALLPTLGTALLISGKDAWFNRRLLGSSPMVFLGRISYPLYLWHWPILVIMKIVKGSVLTPVERLMAVGTAIVLAYLTYRLIENRVRHSAKRPVAPALMVVLACIACFGAIAMTGTLQPRLRGEDISKILAAGNDWEYPPVSSNLHSLGALRYSVMTGRHDSNTLFLGDSNMEQYGPRIDFLIKEHAEKSNGAILIGNQRACSLLREIMAPTHICDSAMDRVNSLILEPSTRRIVIMASWVKFSEELQSESARQSFIAFLRRLSPDKTVYIVLNTPAGMDLSPKSMFSGSRLSHISPKSVSEIRFDRNIFSHRMDPLHNSLRNIAASSGAIIIDPLETLCAANSCPIFDSNGNPLYLDEDHMTRTYVRTSATYIDKTLLN